MKEVRHFDIAEHTGSTACDLVSEVESVPAHSGKILLKGGQRRFGKGGEAAVFQHDEGIFSRDAEFGGLEHQLELPEIEFTGQQHCAI